MPTKRVSVRCRVGAGLHRGELVVRLQARDGHEYETWADESSVRVDDPDDLAGHEARGTVEVRPVGVSGEHLLIELPNEVIAAGRRIWIEQKLVVP